IYVKATDYNGSHSDSCFYCTSFLFTTKSIFICDGASSVVCLMGMGRSFWYSGNTSKNIIFTTAAAGILQCHVYAYSCRINCGGCFLGNSSHSDWHLSAMVGVLV